MRDRARLLGLTAFLAAAPLVPAQTNYTAAVDPNLVLVDSFEGWGTSLCWWANVIGGYANRTAYASLAFTQLKLNIVRYNIGGGENPGIPNTMEYRARVPGFEPSPGVWDWSADANQRWMLRQAVALGANRVIAFANSPPWWMTVSGSVTGSTNGTDNNLQTGYETNFAGYLATVISNLTVLDGVAFENVSVMNEPTANWWTYGGRQEGCHMSPDQQARVINALRPGLNAHGLSAGLEGSEDNSEQGTINSLNAYSSEALSNTDRFVTHTYGANNPVGLRNLAAARRKPLWVSEYGDGDASGLTMARRIHDDLAQTWAHAWVYWQVVDNAGGWGCLLNPMDGSGNTAYSVNKKFYALAQFTQFIRPGFQLINVYDNNTLAAYQPTNHTLVLVAVNDLTNALTATYDLGSFSTLPGQCSRYRTSGTENELALPALTLSGKQLVALLAPQSITTHVLANVTVAPPSLQPLAWYRLEGNAQDESGHGNDGVPGGSVTFGPGKLGAQAAQFNGLNAYIQIPRCISNHFTISLWVKTTATTATGQWWAGQGLVDGEVGGTVDDFGLALVGSKAGFGVGNPDTTITSASAINNGQWHHVAATRDAVSGQMSLYSDGALQASAYGPVGTKAAPPSLRIGSIQPGYSGGFFSGAIDDVQLFGRVFTAAEIPQLMNHRPALAPVANAAIIAGQTLSVTNTATDPDLPAQSLSYSLLSPPVGAGINTGNGLFTWRPPIASAPGTQSVAVVVADNGTPSLSATQTFTVSVTQPDQPMLAAIAGNGGALELNVSGDAGPDYIIETTSSLLSPQWVAIYTNRAAAPPFTWVDTNLIDGLQQFYRVRLGP